MHRTFQRLSSKLTSGWGILFSLIIAIAGVGHMVYEKVKNPWGPYINRPSRVLRIELGMPYDAFIENNPKNIFAESNPYEGVDDYIVFSMDPIAEPNMSTVIVEYGFPKVVFTLPRSTFVSPVFVAGHLRSVSIKPLLYPVKREEALSLASDLIRMFNNSNLKISKDKFKFTLEEVKLRMQLPRRDMDYKSFPVGNWQRKEPYGIGEFQLLIEVLDRKLPPAEQLYSVDVSITGLDLHQRLSNLVKDARRRIPLVGTNGPCSPDDYKSCEYDDMRIYLNALRKAGLSPLKPQ
ncbi:hypothetical protein [Pseudomonas mangiferae]|uniref:Uncharacterized protein n=1 Tax=Pseudomonas mangiferae TaxID=2593654 RepID=A0A553GV81_9PSED|nr:hypothetical protein [Pseudomonas mangiferae]TRX73414.1 hypothetical protein FM069_17575 [Pseudomonas mangiferae]